MQTPCNILFNRLLFKKEHLWFCNENWLCQKNITHWVTQALAAEQIFLNPDITDGVLRATPAERASLRCKAIGTGTTTCYFFVLVNLDGKFKASGWLVCLKV